MYCPFAELRPPVTGGDLRDYFMKHVVPHKLDFYRVVRPLHAFKKVYTHNDPAIANLIIPKDAVVYADILVWRKRGSLVDRKMRATSAQVHSIVSTASGRLVELAYSGHDHSRYRVGETKKPSLPFSYHSNQCASGIHFFLNVSDAWEY